MKRGISGGISLRRRGMVLVGVMITLLFVLAIALIGVVGAQSTGSLSDRTHNSMQFTRMRIATYGAQNMADAGVRSAMQWLNQQGGPPDNLTPFRPSQVSTFWTSAVNGNYDTQKMNGTDDSEGSFDVRFYPYADNSTAPMRSFVIESVGHYNGQRQIVRAAIIQDTFARFAFFSDNAPKGTWWVSGTTTFNGPVHINGRNMDPADTANYDATAAIKILWQNSGNPAADRIFNYDSDASFTTSVSQDKLTWAKGNRTNIGQPPTTDSDWKSIAYRGSAGVKANVGYIEMPTQSTKQLDACLGNPPATIPAGIGVTVPAAGTASKGGIYINGNIDNMEMSASGSNNDKQVMVIYQNDGTKSYRTTVTIDPTASGGGKVTVVKDSANGVPANGSWNASSWATMSTNNYTGTTNGVIYANGNIGTQTSPKMGGLSGTVADNYMSGSNIAKANNLTIVTDATKSVNINGNLTYKSLDAAGQPVDKTAVLGIVSNRVQVIRQDKTGAELGDVTVHATVMTYDTFDAEDPLLRNYPNVKNFTLLGGYIAKNPGTFAGIDASGNPLTGFRVNRNYDARVANRPPPYFPSTSNQYKLRSYQRMAKLITDP